MCKCGPQGTHVPKTAPRRIGEQYSAKATERISPLGRAFKHLKK